MPHPNALSPESFEPDLTSTPLHRAQAQNEAAQSALEVSASELALVNTVLKQELPESIQSDDVALALEKNGELQCIIHDVAQDLADVNQALTQEITERAALETELVLTKAELKEVRQDASAG